MSWQYTADTTDTADTADTEDTADTAGQEVRPDYRFLQDNKYFITVANIIHRHGLTQNMTDLVRDISSQRKKDMPCTAGDVSQDVGDMLTAKYGDISDEAIYKDDITHESLEIAASIYFDLTFCSDIDVLMVQFYQQLFENFPLGAVLKTLARILSVASEMNLTEHYQTAKALFDKTYSTLKLQYRDVAAATTRAGELQLYKELESHQVNQEILQSKQIWKIK